MARAKLSLQPGLQGRGGLQGRAAGLQGGAGRGLQGPRAGRGGDEEIEEAAEEGGGSEPPLRRLRLQVTLTLTLTLTLILTLTLTLPPRCARGT